MDGRTPLPRSAVIERLRAVGCVYAEDEADLLLVQARTADELETLVARRASGTPLEHVLGWVEFAGFRVSVDPGVFVPRRRTELLAAQAVRVARPGEVVVDLCCGTGAVALALATAVQGLEVHAVDLDAAAVVCAARNLAGIGGLVHQGDLYDALPEALRGRVAVITANAPYVPTGALATMPTEARDHEPRVAHDGGPDGLDVQRRVVAGARDWLTDGGQVFVETSREQASRSLELLRAVGFGAVLVISDELDATVVIGHRYPRPMTR